jgi:serine/threonine protein phosphatase PrpC
MKFSVFQTSHKGGRPLNEDRLGYSYTREAVLLVLADGMGGHPDGEVAAQIAVQVYTERFRALARPALPEVESFLVDTLMLANDAIMSHAEKNHLDDNPRTTLVAAVVQEGHVTAVHTGDSRFYWVRNGMVLQRTRDHSYQEKSNLIKHGTEHVSRNILFTCLGSPTSPLYDVMPAGALQQGDRLLLCSDGLWGVVDDDDVATRLTEGPLSETLPSMTRLALERGGRHGDNVSTLALDWETPEDFEPTRVIHTDTLSDDGFASTFQLAPLDGELADFDDDAIERSIAEINDAIRRTAQRKHT